MTTNPTPLTAEYIAEQYIDEEEYNIAPFINMVEAYAAQQNAELMQQLNNETTYQALQRDEIEALQAENERLKQQMIKDVKLLRAALEECSRTRSIGWPMNEKTREALAATDRPEYREEG